MKYLLVLSFLLFYGCGTNTTQEIDDNPSELTEVDSNEENINNPETPSVTEDMPNNEDGTWACVEKYYTSNVQDIVKGCTACHSEVGPAKDTRLIFSDNQTENQATLLSFMTKNPKLLIQMNTGVRDHRGGANFSDYDTVLFENFESYGTNIPLCKLHDNISYSSLSLSQVKLIDYKATAKKFILKVYNRDASEEELKNITTEVALTTYMDTLFADEDNKLYDWLMFEFNDVFQLDAFLGNYFTYVPTASAGWFSTFRNSDSTKWNYLAKGVNYGISRQTLALITHVVKENITIDEILTADYIMVNPFSAISWDLNNSEYYDQTELAGFMYDGGSDYKKYSWNKFKKAKIRIYGTNERRIHAAFPDIEYYPHAGILNDLQYLKKYSTTGTNRNRFRARKLATFFLGLDIEGIAVRSSGDTTHYEKPTIQNPNCTVCHYVMDPIAGAYHNFNYTLGSQYYLPRSKGWFDKSLGDMFPIGYSFTDPMPDEFRQNSLQWLATRIIKDPRFIYTMVEHFYKALTSNGFLKRPKTSDYNFEQKLQAYNLQQLMIKDVIAEVEASDRKSQSLIKSIVVSPLFRSKSIDIGNSTLETDKLISDATLLTPEQLDAKLNTLMETKNKVDYNTLSQWNYLSKEYNLLYGGIDNRLQRERSRSMDAIKAGVQKRVAFSAGCEALSFDLYYPKGKWSDKVLTPFVDIDTTPESEANIIKIKQNIQHLHHYLRKEDLSLDSPELLLTYDLLKASYEDLKAVGYTRLTGCTGTYNYQGDKQENNIDRTFMVRTWSIVVNYMVDDFYFFYNLPEGDK